MTEAPNWLLLGGDTRAISLTNGSGKSTNLLMQSDIELALRLSDQVAFVGAGGYYGVPLPEWDYKPKPEARRAYLLLSPQPWLTLRAGKFMPGWGLMIPDHTANIRGGFRWPQGSETNNLELGLYSKFGEVILTADEKGNRYTRLVAYATDKTQAGLSYTEGAYGFFLVTALGPKAYAMAEFDSESEVEIKGNIGTLKTNQFFWGQLAGELGKSFWLLGNYSVTLENDRQTIYSYGFQWFPFPHFELFGKLQTEQTKATYLLMGHYYL